jgi:MFS family permease
MFGLSDRFSPSRVFFLSTLAASVCNVFSLIHISSLPLMIYSRLATGFFLAGIYPIGMKIAADWKSEGLGHWLGALVGALVLGTAFPHSLKLIPGFVDPKILLMAISGLCVIGGLLVWRFVPDGPYRKKSSAFTFYALRKIFRIPLFRSPAFGYFGHMWELYTFWAFTPWIIREYASTH